MPTSQFFPLVTYWTFVGEEVWSAVAVSLSDGYSPGPELAILKYFKYYRRKAYLCFHFSSSYSLRRSWAGIVVRFSVSCRSRSSVAASVWYLLIHPPSPFLCSFLPSSFCLSLHSFVISFLFPPSSYYTLGVTLSVDEWSPSPFAQLFVGGREGRVPGA